MKNLLLFSCLSLFLFIQCSTPASTNLIDTWEDQNYSKGTWQKVLIVGIGKNPNNRAEFEKQLAKRILKNKVEAVAALDVLPPDEKIDRDVFYKYFSDQNIDAVIVSRLASVQEMPNIKEPGQAPGFYEFYDNNYEAMPEGAIPNYVIFGVETQVYETKGEKMVWQGITNSFQGGKGEGKKVVSELANVIAKSLKEDGFLK